jgi:hypothetical protein
LLAIIERPNFVALDTAGLHVTDHFVVHFGADRAGVDQALGDGVEAHVGHTRSGPHAHAFAQKVEDLDSLRNGQLVHAQRI